MNEYMIAMGERQKNQYCYVYKMELILQASLLNEPL